MRTNKLQKIIEIDRYRYPIPVTIFLKLLKPEYSFYNVSNDVVLLKIKKLMRDEGEKNIKIRLGFIIFIFIIFSVVKLFVHLGYLRTGAFINLFMLIIVVLFVFVYLPYFYQRAANKIAGHNDEELKSAAQGIIDEVAKYFREHNIDPKKYPIRLRHNDYEGLRYEKKGENNYIGYVKVD
jgi:Ca2+/Na+ antiporter